MYLILIIIFVVLQRKIRSYRIIIHPELERNIRFCDFEWQYFKSCRFERKYCLLSFVLNKFPLRKKLGEYKININGKGIIKLIEKEKRKENGEEGEYFSGILKTLPELLADSHFYPGTSGITAA